MKNFKTILIILLVFCLLVCVPTLIREKTEKNNIQQQLDIIFVTHFEQISENLSESFPSEPEEIENFMEENLRCCHLISRTVSFTSYAKNEWLVKLCRHFPQICNENFFINARKELRENINKLLVSLDDKELAEKIYNEFINLLEQMQ